MQRLCMVGGHGKFSMTAVEFSRGLNTGKGVMIKDTLVLTN